MAEDDQNTIYPLFPLRGARADGGGRGLPKDEVSSASRLPHHFPAFKEPRSRSRRRAVVVAVVG